MTNIPLFLENINFNNLRVNKEYENVLLRLDDLSLRDFEDKDAVHIGFLMGRLVFLGRLLYTLESEAKYRALVSAEFVYETQELLIEAIHTCHQECEVLLPSEKPVDP